MLRKIFNLAEDRYGKDSVALITWLYRQAVERHRVFAFLESTDELGHDARRDIQYREARMPDSYLREGLSIVKRIRGIVETMEDPEAEAMAMIYHADFQMLMGMGLAARLYRAAMKKLQQAGFDDERIDAFFARPVVLPVEQYDLNLNDALTQQIDYGYTVEPGEGGSDDVVHMGDFVAWNESLPFARRPTIPELVAAVTTGFNTVTVQFSIDSRGKSKNTRARQAEPDVVRVRRDAQDGIKEMQFRPRFVKGRWRPTDNVTMRYLYPPPQ